MGQPVRQASELTCEGSVCHPKEESKKKATLCIRCAMLSATKIDIALTNTVGKIGKLSNKQHQKTCSPGATTSHSRAMRCIMQVKLHVSYRGRPAMAKYSFRARRYSFSSSGLRKTFGRCGNPVRSSLMASDRTELTAIVHSRTATTSSRVDSRTVIIKRSLKKNTLLL